MSNTSKEVLREEIAKLSKEKGVDLPEGLDDLKQLALFDALEALTGEKDSRRPVGLGAGAVRASSPPGAPAPEAAAAASEAVIEVEEIKSVKGKSFSASGRYIVAEGLVVHCLKGPVGAFQEIRDIDLGDGEAELDALFAAGTIVAAKR